MAIRRKDISAVLGDESHINDDDMSKLLDLIHKEVDGIRDEKDQVSEQLKEAQAALEAEKSAKEGAVAAKTAAEKALNDYKDEQAQAAEKSSHEKAYRSLLTDAGISEKHIDKIMRVINMDDVKFNQDGTVRDSAKVLEGIKTEWADFISVEQTAPAGVEAPPQNTAGTNKMSRDEIMAITDRAERRAAIAANPEAFRRKE